MKVREVPGYIHGFSQPAVVFTIEAGLFAQSDGFGPRLWTALQTSKENSGYFQSVLDRITAPKTPAAAGATAMAVCLLRFLDAAGMPISDPPVIREHAEEQFVEVAVPVYNPQVSVEVMRWIMQLVPLLQADPDMNRLPSSQLATFVWFLNRLDQAAPPGANNIRLMRAAQAAGIPYMVLSDGIHQYGWGIRGRWFLGTVTDETPGLSRTICSDKVKTKEVLSKAGIPVPPGGLVSSAEQAMQVAQKMGYPVVVKPADRERGEAVAANLKSPMAVAAAFKEAAALSTRVVLEKHLPGQVYRAHVYRGEIWVLSGRIPAGVTGDGVHDIATLVQRENNRRKKEQTLVAQLNPIRIDAEALALLSASGMTQNSVPDDGRFVALKEASNASTGGRLTPFDGKLHPQTEKMLLRAASVLKIDLTSFDLVSTDIEKPWYDAETTIIEANSGPQLSMLYPEYDQRLLETYVAGRGRIPTALLLTSSSDVRDQVLKTVQGDTTKSIGVASLERTCLGGEVVMEQSADLLTATTSLAVNPRCEAILIIGDGGDIRRLGLPLDRIDILALARWSPSSEDAGAIIGELEPHLSGDVYAVSEEWEGLRLTRATVERKPDLEELLSVVYRHIGAK